MPQFKPNKGWYVDPHERARREALDMEERRERGLYCALGIHGPHVLRSYVNPKKEIPCGGDDGSFNMVNKEDDRQVWDKPYWDSWPTADIHRRIKNHPMWGKASRIDLDANS